MITLNIYSETISKTEEAYFFYFRNKISGLIYRVFTGGVASSARAAGLIKEKFKLDNFTLQELSPEIKKHKDLILKAKPF